MCPSDHQERVKQLHVKWNGFKSTWHSPDPLAVRPQDIQTYIMLCRFACTQCTEVYFRFGTLAYWESVHIKLYSTQSWKGWDLAQTVARMQNVKAELQTRFWKFVLTKCCGFYTWWTVCCCSFLQKGALIEGSEPSSKLSNLNERCLRPSYRNCMTRHGKVGDCVNASTKPS